MQGRKLPSLQSAAVYQASDFQNHYSCLCRFHLRRRWPPRLRQETSCFHTLWTWKEGCRMRMKRSASLYLRTLHSGTKLRDFHWKTGVCVRKCGDFKKWKRMLATQSRTRNGRTAAIFCQPLSSSINFLRESYFLFSNYWSCETSELSLFPTGTLEDGADAWILAPK